MLTVKKKGKRAWVTFTFSPTYEVNDVAISGEWNEWDEEPMKKKKNGDYYITKVFSDGDTYQFGYKINHNDWIAEHDCTRVPTIYASENSVLEV